MTGDDVLLGPLPEPRRVKKAVILAAGRGKRMGRLTADRPKAALTVGGHALIDWQIAALRRAGIEEIAVVTGHAHEAIAGRDVHYIHNTAWDRGSQVDSLLCAAKWIGDDPVVVSYSDILYHPSAVLALFERPGDIVVAYDADHRWLWKRRFGNWLKDSETFRLGPGQVLTEIGARPDDIEAVEGQFMGLMLFAVSGFVELVQAWRQLKATGRQPDFTAIFAHLLGAGRRIDTAVNMLPWMEVDSRRDLAIAEKMAETPVTSGPPPLLNFPQPAEPTTSDFEDHCPSSMTTAGVDLSHIGAIAVQNWGRSGSTLVQSLLDDHPQLLSTPNFYSRGFFTAWARCLGLCPDTQKVDAFLESFSQWWDSAEVDATAGLHTLGPTMDEIAGVDRAKFAAMLGDILVRGRPITRRTLLVAAHLAYARARGQILSGEDLRLVFPVHGLPRGSAAALLEDFPQARFIHTLREPAANVASTMAHAERNKLLGDGRVLKTTLGWLFFRQSDRQPRYTLFGAEAYFQYLVDIDRARALRLEDLHYSPEATVRSLALWLGVPFHPVLLSSTWDGKIWWNRPESYSPGDRESRLGNAPRRQPLSRRDLDRVYRLALGSPTLTEHYVRPSRSATSSRPPVGPLLGRWEAERHAMVSDLARLRSVRRAVGLFGRSPPEMLARYLEREEQRARLEAMSIGSVEVRRRLPAAQRSEPVRAVLLLRKVGNGWRQRILLRRRADRVSTPAMDELTIGFLADALRRPCPSELIAEGVVLLLGGFLARVEGWFALRTLLLNSVSFSKAPRTPMERIGL